MGFHTQLEFMPIAFMPPGLGAVRGSAADLDTRGVGETVRSTGVAEYHGGTRVFSAGTWDA